VTDHPENFCFLSDQRLKVIGRKKGPFATLEDAGEMIAQFEQYAIKE
jgi:hypothetical protein